MIIPRNLPILNTKRLILTPLKVNHLKYTIKWRLNKRIRNTLQNNSPLDINNQINWYKTSRKIRIDYLVFERITKEPIGVWSFKKTINRKKFLKIMEQGRYIGNDKFLGKGLASEVALCWLDFGFNFLNLDKIISIHISNNIVPQKINLKIGFKYDTKYINKKEKKMEISKSTYYSE